MSELRSNRRLNVDFDAFVTATGLRDHPCRVKDFCLGGALLSFDDPLRPVAVGLSALARGAAIELRIVTRAPGSREAYTFAATVARRDALTLGVAFVSPDPTSLLALQSLANANNTRQWLAGRGEVRKARFDEATVRKAVVSLVDIVRTAIEDLPAAIVAECQQPIAKLAANAVTNEEHNQIRDGVTMLRRYATTLQSGFVQQVLKSLESFGNWQPGASIPGAGASSKLSLIDKGAFEDWLAIKVMVSRAEADCKAPLFELQIRLNEMFGAQMGVQNNPVGPMVFYHALGEPLQKLKLPRPMEQVLLKALETMMLNRLSRLYPALNETLSRQGILPDIEIGKYTTGRQAGAPRLTTVKPVPTRMPVQTAVQTAVQSAVQTPKGVPIRPQGAAAAATNAVSAAESTSSGQGAPVAAVTAPSVAAPTVVPPAVNVAGHGRAELSIRQFELQQKIARQAWVTVKSLLATRRQAGAAMPSGASAGEGGAGRVDAEPAAVWSEQAVVAALDALQKASAQRAAVADAVPLQQLLQQALDPRGDAGRQLPAAQAEAASTVDQLFREMVETPLLRDDARVLIRQLEVPFLKLLLADRDFFSAENHPARQVLNRLASLGARGAMTTPQQQQTMQDVVSSLVTRFERDIGVFNDALAALEKMLAQQRRVYEHNLQRVRQSSEGRQRIVQARRQVLRLLEDRVGGRRVPRAALTLLDAGWRESLVNTLLRHGSDSAAWREQIGVIDMMVQGRDGLAAVNMKALLAVIKKGLSTQASGQISRDAVVKDLREMFTALSSGNPDAVPMVDVPPGAVDPEAHIVVAEVGNLGRWLKRVRDMAVGDWVEFAESEDAGGAKGEGRQQARLAWVDEARNQFVFVNLQGMKVLDLDVESLAHAFYEQRVRRIEDPETPLVDRGLEAMVRKVYGQLAHRAMHDELTGLYNRKEFEKQLSRQVGGFRAGDKPWSLCWLDLDQFKVINSTCGFEAGDEMIRLVAKTLVAAAGSGARLARLGGDEFAVLIMGDSDEQRKRPGHGLLAAIDTIRFQWQGRSWPVNASVGVVFVSAGDISAEELMKTAEAACYAAKEAGRNRVHVFKTDDVQLKRRDNIIKWVSRLNQAIETDNLQLRCQRIEPVDAASGLLPHYEILIAMEDEGGEFIPPSSFMQAAERYNRMHAVDRWVVQNTLAWMYQNPEKIAATGGFSINLSGQSLNDEKLTAYILKHVLESGVPTDKITFEVTETAAIANIADAADFIREMQAVGCKFSLDDFGSGLSSYSYLKNLPVDYVKIDGVFIRDIHNNAADYMMVRSINEMAHFMGKRTVAEYVENEEILVKLREIGVDFAQGYGIERPKPLSML